MGCDKAELRLDKQQTILMPTPFREAKITWEVCCVCAEPC